MDSGRQKLEKEKEKDEEDSEEDDDEYDPLPEKLEDEEIDFEEEEEEEGEKPKEQTFVLIYKNTIRNAGLLLRAIEKRFCTLKGFKMFNIGEKFATKFMDGIWDKTWFGCTKEERIRRLTYDSVLAMVVEGQDAVYKLNHLFSGKFRIHGIFFDRVMVYQSPSVEKAKLDINMWFPEQDDSWSDDNEELHATFLFRHGQHVNLDKYHENVTQEGIDRVYFPDLQNFILIKDAAVRRHLVGKIICLLQFKYGVVKGFKMSNVSPDDDTLCAKYTCGIVEDSRPVAVAVIWNGPNIHEIIKEAPPEAKDYYEFDEDEDSGVFGSNLVYVTNDPDSLTKHITSWFPHGLVLLPYRFGTVFEANLYTDTKFLADSV